MCEFLVWSEKMPSCFPRVFTLCTWWLYLCMHTSKWCFLFIPPCALGGTGTHQTQVSRMSSLGSCSWKCCSLQYKPPWTKTRYTQDGEGAHLNTAAPTGRLTVRRPVLAGALGQRCPLYTRTVYSAALCPMGCISIPLLLILLHDIVMFICYLNRWKEKKNASLSGIVKKDKEPACAC